MSGVRKNAMIWALSTGFSKIGTEVADLYPKLSQGWTHLLCWDKNQQMFILLKVPPRFIKSYTKFTNSFHKKMRTFWTKIISNLCTRSSVQMFPFFFFFFLPHKRYSISILYLTSSPSNLVHQGTAHYLIQNFTKMPMINQKNPLASVSHIPIWHLSVHPHTRKPTLVTPIFDIFYVSWR